MGRTAVIVGGGIGGLAAAAALHRRGWSVTVLEQAVEFGEVGASIALWPNAFRALDSIGSTGAIGGERMGAVGGLRDWRGRWIVRPDVSEAAGEHTATAVVAHRHELLSTLLDLVPARSLRSGVRVLGVRRTGSRAVVEHDGGELDADLVVGADGVRSQVRRALWPRAQPPRYSGQVAWRVVMPRPDVLADGSAGAWAETWGPGAVFGVFPMPGDRAYCYATAVLPPGGRGPDGELTELRRRFRDWCDPIPAVLASARPEQVLRNDMYHLPHLRTYVSGPVVLLGDAAHAMMPNLGQGGCQALEDAATLGIVLDGEPDLTRALRRYDELRRPRTQGLSRRSLLAARVSHLERGSARLLRDASLRATPRSVFVRALASASSWRPEDGVTPIRRPV